MIEAVIFDMDGLLIDSEPFWQDAERKIFNNFGIEITPELHKTTYGLPVNEMIEQWYQYKPWNNYNPEKIRYEIFDMVEQQIQEKGVAMKGVNYILEFFSKKKIKMALASASPDGIINAVIKKLNIEKEFSVIHSGDIEKYGKPHPAVYLTTSEKLNTSPINCLVFEDSVFGLIAAKAARMRTVAVPGKGEENNPKYILADLKLASLNDFAEKHFEILNSFH